MRDVSSDSAIAARATSRCAGWLTGIMANVSALEARTTRQGRHGVVSLGISGKRISIHSVVAWVAQGVGRE
ncbi:hypothetical protein IG631_21778 [Alternaria alternata]|jgi:hypothetical protein|nr:hypothetical protein IG631_21778 [Alternaria alternata]